MSFPTKIFFFRQQISSMITCLKCAQPFLDCVLKKFCCNSSPLQSCHFPVIKPMTQCYTFLCTLNYNVTQYFITLKQPIPPLQMKQKTLTSQKHKVFICPILFNIPDSGFSLNCFDNTLHMVFLTICFRFIKYSNHIT